MSKLIFWCVFLFSTVAVIVLSVTCPTILGDRNSFLKIFVSNGFPILMATITSITLMSAGIVHIELNKYEEKINRPGFFEEAKRRVKISAQALLVIFPMSIALAVIKPFACHYNKSILCSLINGLALLIVLFAVLILASLAKSTFAIKPIFSETDQNS